VLAGGGFSTADVAPTPVFEAKVMQKVIVASVSCYLSCTRCYCCMLLQRISGTPSTNDIRRTVVKARFLMFLNRG
jgi:hypothetical protein